MIDPNLLTDIVVNEKNSEIIPFLKSLSAEDKKFLIPHIKNLSKEYLDYKQVKKNGMTQFVQKSTDLQREIIGLILLVCYNQKDFEKHVWLLNNEAKLNRVFDWYCPAWFNDYINKFGGKNHSPFFLSYGWIMQLSDKGYIRPSKELIADLISNMIYERRSKEIYYRPENLVNREDTLTDHIWYIFEYETSIFWNSNFFRLAEDLKPEDCTWSKTLTKLCDEGKIDRLRLLKESLLATSRNFNKNLSGWFVEMFNQLDPSNDELLKLQNELFNALDSSHSKPVNSSLRFIKRIAGNKSFQAGRFLEKATILLTSDTKSIVLSSISLIEVIGKIHKGKLESICKLACNAFIHRDAEIQIKAARILQKYGSKVSTAIQDELASYEESLLNPAKELLQEFLQKSANKRLIADSDLQVSDPKPKVRIHDGNKIEPIDSFDEFLFLASQAFDGNESYHFDLLMAAIIRLQEEFDSENITRLEPAFQRAYKLVMNDWSGSTGFLDHMLATFFIEFSRFLIANYTSHARSLAELYDHYERKDLEKKKQSPQYYNIRIIPFSKWKTNSAVYQPYWHLLRITLRKIEVHSSLPLLSTPTHTPCWISPKSLIDRLSMYQTSGRKPDEKDFQIAISRCAIDNDPEIRKLINEKITGEYAGLMNFLMGNESNPPHRITMPSVWAIACLAKRNIEDFEKFGKFPYNQLNPDYLTGQFEWDSVLETSLEDRYDYTAKKLIKVPVTIKKIKLDLNEKLKKENAISSIISKFFKAPRKEPYLIYEYLSFNEKYLYVEHNDITRLLYLLPNNPEPLLAQIIERCLADPRFMGETSKKLVARTLAALLEIWDDFGKTAHLFVGTCLTSGDKTIRDYASEIWINGVNNNNINSLWLGEIIGRQERIEFAPIKRFTDLIMSNMFQLSVQHNTELEKLLTACIEILPGQPINNLKKLLEIYAEILALNRTKSISQKVVNQFELWNSSESLNKVIKTIKSRISNYP